MQIAYARKRQIRVSGGIAHERNIFSDFRHLARHILYERMRAHRKTRFISAHPRTLAAHEHEPGHAHAQIVASARFPVYNQEQTTGLSLNV